VSDDFGGHPMVTAHGAVGTFVEAQGLDSVDIIGNSMGGGVGINYAIRKPANVRHLVTIGGIGTNILTPGPSEGIRLLQEFTENPSRQRLVDWLHSMVYDPAVVTDELIEERWALATDPPTLESARRMYGRAAFDKMMTAMRTSDAPMPWAMMHKVAAPTLLTWGRDDRVSPLDMALIPMRTIPNAELHVFPNCGHWAMIEAKQAFEDTVLSFLLREERQCWVLPALATMTSRRPMSATPASTTSGHGLEMSDVGQPATQRLPRFSTSVAVSRNSSAAAGTSIAITSAPSSANRSQCARPIPLAAPVTATTLSTSPDIRVP
jgi:pimeloyl-ACP methyl ester carboxylesterase